MFGRLPLSRGLGRLLAFNRPQIGIRHFASTTGQSTVISQLRRVGELQQRVSVENSKARKQQIIAEYPDLRELLEMIYDPNHRAHLSLATVQTRLNNLPRRITSFAAPDSVIEVLTRLSKQEVTGHDAKDLVIQFLAGHGILDQQTYELKQGKEAEFELFGKLLDRNLIAGFGARTLSMVDWKSDTIKNEDLAAIEAQSAESSPATAHGHQTTSMYAQAPASPVRNLKSFPVALGKSIEPPFTEIAKSTCKWYASRKLDGVRVIAFLDIGVPYDGSESWTHDVNFFSRTGKPFTSLGKVEEALVRLGHHCPLPEQYLLEGSNGNVIGEDDDGLIKRLVFDGEVCVMREKTGLESSDKRSDEGTGAGAIWSDDDLKEDFTSTVSEIRRMPPHEISHPVYYILDILPYDLFAAGKGPSKFSKRVQDIRDIGDWLAAQENEQKILRPLAQWEVKDPSEIDGMVARAAEEGWEGLVFRADKPYKGSRSSDIRKFKKWQDAEYTVIDVENSRMRLAVNGVYGEYDAMANIWVEHKGVRVSVGSGFTADQRIQFGKNPELIVGKDVTVEYFSESASSSREGLSLRFPRVKQIWSEGKRTV